MTIDIIQTSYDNLDVTNLLPSFMQWIFGGALGLNPALFGIGFLMIIALVSFLIFKNNGIDIGMVTSSIITIISGLLFVKAGWISGQILFVTFIYFAFSIYYLYSHRSQVEA